MFLQVVMAFIIALFVLSHTSSQQISLLLWSHSCNTTIFTFCFLQQVEDYKFLQILGYRIVAALMYYLESIPRLLLLVSAAFWSLQSCNLGQPLGNE
jgi:D-alanyl-lipoteichoic acid acyltransferase DltB (MBOAT superfamily)